MIPALRLVGADRAVKRILEFRNDLRAEQADRQARVVNSAARVTHVAAAIGALQPARVRTGAFTQPSLRDIPWLESQRADLARVLPERALRRIVGADAIELNRRKKRME